jgi:TPR repeat protein
MEAEKNNPEQPKTTDAQTLYNTGMCFLLGQGGEIDEPTGLKLVAQAAQMGLEQALFELAQYTHIMGTHEHMKIMIEGMRGLAAKGDEDAKTWLRQWQEEGIILDSSKE